MEVEFRRATKSVASLQMAENFFLEEEESELDLDKKGLKQGKNAVNRRKSEAVRQ